MKHGEFVALVKALRNAQTEYFATRAAPPLERAKALAYQVDQAIAEYWTRDEESDTDRSRRMLHVAYLACRESLPTGTTIPDDFVVRVGKRLGVRREILLEWSREEKL